MDLLSYSDQAVLTETGEFQSRLWQAVLTAAVAIMNEDAGTAHHEARAGLARMCIANPAGMKAIFIPLAATRLTSVNALDSALFNAVAAVWNTAALAFYPGSE